ncbi:ROK family protein [Acidiferrimicrobium sp. IK]|uniref:ROK family protein n=1 Tax=Acidiferrimicrobium sp. IK TaxID=2871700 RepID=UPI0021CB9369|nr:ROK family protein [Acidiferrimicrobium sp. IK]MCU4183699.1 ROK family protein [Acidiferrimicrobium sp. IK]
MASPSALAVDIGGTKMAVAIVDTEGRIGWSERAATPQGAPAEEVWEVLAGLLTRAPGGSELCGVGCGGPMARGGETVSPLNIAGWREFPLRARVASLTGLPTWVDNDAKALALAEGWRGAAAGEANFLSMVVSTGVGGGIVLEGRLLDGAAGNAGHIGHVIVEPGGRPCPCGAAGCLEAEASGTSIAAMTGAPAAVAGPDIRRRTGTMVGRAVASVANLLDLRLATVAGSVALGYGREFLDAAQEEIDRRARLSFSAGCRIEASGLGTDGPLVGAAAVGWRGAGRLGAVGGSACFVTGPAAEGAA